MSKTYTEHKLTNPMLERLSAICNGRVHKWGASLCALEVRGLVEPYEKRRLSPPEKRDGVSARWSEPTEAGRQALADARREGW